METTPAAAEARRRILEIAQPLLLRKGFTAVGLTELLAAARIPKGSFYHYFDSKEAFGEALLESYFADYFAHMDALLAAPGSAADGLLGYFVDWLAAQTCDQAQNRCLAIKLGAEVCDLSESLRAALERGTRGVVERLARAIDAGRADGSLPATLDARTTAVALYQSWLGAGLLAKIARDRAPLDTAMAGTRQMLGLVGAH